MGVEFVGDGALALDAVLMSPDGDVCGVCVEGPAVGGVHGPTGAVHQPVVVSTQTRHVLTAVGPP